MKIPSFSLTASWLVILGIPTAVYAGGFLSTCSVSYSGRLVRGSCKNTRGAWVPASIDTNKYFGNVNGNLVRNGAAYISSCRNCHIIADTNKYVLYCDCLGGSIWVPNGIDLNYILSNQNGVLTWDR
ncbi:hypothetical protein ABW20_dc0102049 [Dactylellina cionopaga]|nr:hypothetical protein ABW20_dc0102049 [Dactylellina cionopaga]